VKITLTFDNGPDRDITPRVLDMLTDHDVSATFFLVGKQLETEDGLALLRRTAMEHGIGNHSFSHSVPLGMQHDAEAIEEIAATAALLGEHARHRLFRPFGRRGVIGPHLMNGAAWDYLAAHRYNCILWNCLAREWDRPDDWAEPTLADCALRPWSVVVVHDILPEVPGQLELFLRGLIDQNCEFSRDFPDDCVAMRDGVATSAARALMGAGHAPTDAAGDQL
jgi:peptidoglycan/xylan/chitin deacetylase (PgdA/CDA1 family)